MARYVAKNIVAAELAEKCEVQLSYAIGVANPTSINIDCFGTNKISEEKISRLIYENFKLKPKEIIETLNLKKPIYQKTAAYGHFGRNEFPWEETNKADSLKQTTPPETISQTEQIMPQQNTITQNISEQSLENYKNY